MDDVLRAMQARQAARATLPQDMTGPLPQEIEYMEAAKRVQEKARQELVAYKERVAGHMRKLMEGSSKWTQYPPMDPARINLIAQVASTFGLVSHEFGEEGIDRFIIVYKPEFEPSQEEIARMNLKYTHKMDDNAVQKILAGPQPEEEASHRVRTKKREEEAGDAVGPLVPVGTVKRVRRNASEAMEEVRLRKKTQKLAEVDSLFQDDAPGEEDQRDEQQEEEEAEELDE